MRLLVTSLFGIFLTLAAAGLTSAAAPPGVVTIDTLSELFAGVSFDHQLHQDLASCAKCHHHTTGEAAEPQCAGCHQGRTTATVACRDCHSAQPFSAAFIREKELDRGRYHIDKPGLKAAYHRNCFDCHEESGGPTGCEDCHAKTPAGTAFYNPGSPAEKPAASAH